MPDSNAGAKQDEQPKVYYDEYGNEVNNLVSAEELEKIKKEKDELTSKMASSEPLTDKERKELEDLRNKEMNFNKLRSGVNRQYKRFEEYSEEERSKMSEREKELLQRQDAIEAKERDIVEKTKDSIIERICGDNNDMKEKIKFYYDKIDLPSSTPDEIIRKVNNAKYLAEQNDAVQRNPINDINSFQGGDYLPGINHGNQNTNETDASKIMRQNMGISNDDMKKYSSPNWKPKI